MDKPTPASSSRPAAAAKTSPSWTPLGALLLLLVIVAPVVLSLALYLPQDFHPVPLPADHSFAASIAVPEHHAGILAASERVGEGLLPGPEDLAFDSDNGLLYTGCLDGWIRRVRLVAPGKGGGGDGLDGVEDWARTGGRPLGLVLGRDGSLIVADAGEGLLKIKPDRTVELLADEAEGRRFGLTDGVDIATDGLIYFTDASYKYSLEMHMLDILEGRPHGRLMSFNPSTNRTAVLARDLYFANGVAVSPDQKSLIFCESVLRQCKRYYIRGEKQGSIDKFIDNLPGFPDNIRYDGEGRYWIALSAGRTPMWDTLFKYPILRKMVYIVETFAKLPHDVGDSGVMSVGLEGKPLSLYTDPGLALATSGIKIGGHLYYGSLYKNYISRIDLTKFAADE